MKPTPYNTFGGNTARPAQEKIVYVDRPVYRDPPPARSLAPASRPQRSRPSRSTEPEEEVQGKQAVTYFLNAKEKKLGKEVRDGTTTAVVLAGSGLTDYLLSLETLQDAQERQQFQGVKA